MPVLLYLKAFVRKRGYLLLSLFFVILILLITYGLFCQMIQSKLAERENALHSLPVTVVLSNIAGTQTDHLEIPFYLAEYFTSGEYSYGGEIQPRAFSSYVKDVKMKTTLYYSLPSENMNRADTIPSSQKLVGITCLEADRAISQDVIDSLAFFSGMGESVFETGTPACVIPRRLLGHSAQDEQGRSFLTISVQIAPASQAATELVLQIAGVYDADDDRIYCPWRVAADQQAKLDGFYTVDSLMATVKDNMELSEFQTILFRHFAEVSPGGKAAKLDDSPVLDRYQFAAIVRDETLRQTLKEMDDSLQTALWIKPLLIVLELLVSACSGFFFGSVQRRDLLAARLVGTRMREIVWILFLQLFAVLLLSIFVTAYITTLCFNVEASHSYYVGVGAAASFGCLLSIRNLRKAAEALVARE